MRTMSLLPTGSTRQRRGKRDASADELREFQHVEVRGEAELLLRRIPERHLEQVGVVVAPRQTDQRLGNDAAADLSELVAVVHDLRLLEDVEPQRCRTGEPLLVLWLLEERGALGPRDQRVFLVPH